MGFPRPSCTHSVYSTHFHWAQQARHPICRWHNQAKGKTRKADGAATNPGSLQAGTGPHPEDTRMAEAGGHARWRARAGESSS